MPSDSIDTRGNCHMECSIRHHLSRDSSYPIRRIVAATCRCGIGDVLGSVRFEQAAGNGEFVAGCRILRACQPPGLYARKASDHSGLRPPADGPARIPYRAMQSTQ